LTNCFQEKEHVIIRRYDSIAVFSVTVYYHGILLDTEHLQLYVPPSNSAVLADLTT